MIFCLSPAAEVAELGSEILGREKEDTVGICTLVRVLCEAVGPGSRSR